MNNYEMQMTAHGYGVNLFHNGSFFASIKINKNKCQSIIGGREFKILITEMDYLINQYKSITKDMSPHIGKVYLLIKGERIKVQRNDMDYFSKEYVSLRKFIATSKQLRS